MKLQVDENGNLMGQKVDVNGSLTNIWKFVKLMKFQAHKMADWWNLLMKWQFKVRKVDEKEKIIKQQLNETRSWWKYQFDESVSW